MSEVGLILLAAGASTRMGKPKQLLVYQGETLVRRCARVAQEAGCSPVVVVIGANAQIVRNDLHGMTVLVEENRDWEKGPGTSVRAGLARVLRERPELAGLLITLVDQPLIEAGDLRALMRATTGIAAAEFGGTVGAPAFFGREYFDQLANLVDRNGAKSVLLGSGGALAKFSLERAGMDVDAPDDFARLGE